MDNDNLTFESALKKLEEIAATLEKGDTDLDNAITLYQEGMELTRYCSQKLENAKQKITEIEK